MQTMQIDGGALMQQTLAALVIPDVPSGPVTQYAKITLTAAQVLAMFGAAITLLPAPGAGLVVNILDALFIVNFGTAAFAAGGVVSIRQNAIAIATTSAALVNNGSSIAVQPAFPGMGATQSNGALNALTDITNATQAFTGGTGGGTLDVHLWFAVVKAGQ
jgi:hypothetical protein